MCCSSAKEAPQKKKKLWQKKTGKKGAQLTHHGYSIHICTHASTAALLYRHTIVGLVLNSAGGATSRPQTLHSTNVLADSNTGMHSYVQIFCITNLSGCTSPNGPTGRAKESERFVDPLGNVRVGPPGEGTAILMTVLHAHWLNNQYPATERPIDPPTRPIRIDWSIHRPMCRPTETLIVQTARTKTSPKKSSAEKKSVRSRFDDKVIAPHIYVHSRRDFLFSPNQGPTTPRGSCIHTPQHTNITAAVVLPSSSLTSFASATPHAPITL